MKNKRHQKILEIISLQRIENQDQLQAELLKQGFNVTQSTISRDINQLRIVKSQDNSGKYFYSANTDSLSNSQTENAMVSKYVEVFKNAVIDIRYAMNQVVVKTYSGMASSACVAIDSMFENLVVGSLAGDDTVFVLTQSVDDALELCKILRTLL